MTTLRLHVPVPMTGATALELPPAAVRHLQVRRLQPGELLQVFDGKGCEWQARVAQIGRQAATVELLQAVTPCAELSRAVTLAVVVPANERMDTLVEKAAELGAAALQPLMSERSVLRLDGERAQRRREHWQAVAAAACEQCGRATVPVVAAPLGLGPWLTTLGPPGAGCRWLLSPDDQALPVATQPPLPGQPVLTLSGPEGGLSPAEEALARGRGFLPVSLGPRVLRADTAPLAVLSWLSLLPPAGP